ncbi:zinc ribbon domain-containing protein [uncultured Lutibacter sp.]|uniref:double zinc ribbon domain-containing protein n=1 Tax=uncultured Lutibacter sp. TaxID=437739 RepID=UPI0026225CAF|nr:zinc ribbon domain-containing protein [uncultured Lutibacter sp.]
MKSLNCPNCGNKLNEGALFCGICGGKIIQQAKAIKVDPNTCPNCNTPFEKDEKFCAECGNVINEGVATNKEVPEKKIISKSKPQSIPTITSNPSIKKKKGGILKTIGKIAVGFLAFIIIGSIILYNLGDDLKSTNTSDIDIINTENVNNEEIETSSSTNEKNQIVVETAVDDKNLADKYRNGVGVEPDQYKAFELYEKLANKGDLDAMVELADYYEQGIWLKKDSEKAIKLLKQAAEKGSLAAQWQLEFLESENSK